MQTSRRNGVTRPALAIAAASVPLWTLASGAQTGDPELPEIPFLAVQVDAQGPTNPHIKATGDLNSDGLLDLFVASSNSRGRAGVVRRS